MSTTSFSEGSFDDQVSRLVCECLERMEEEGESALEEVCSRHPDVADLVRARIDSLRRLGLLAPPGASTNASMPETIGHFRILRLVGHGGMGTIFEAEQENPRRRVALKVIRSGFPSDAARRRFATETQLLGLLQHANIAQIFEAGATEIGGSLVPYFAMEFVDGIPVDQYVFSEDSPPREILALIARIAESIDYAHSRGVIHRDLKPANILVDEQGEPKILDFGLARIDDPSVRGSFATQSGQMLGTLPYMSPEQVRGDSHATDRRSDVYSLGVIAYELLARRMPYDIPQSSAVRAAQVICERDPIRLGQLEPDFRGDIETIISTALEKDAERRYATAHDFAADIQRFLHDQPIFARPPSTIYQLKKLVRRHRGLFTGIAAAFVLLVAGTATSSVAWLQATAATREAVDARGDEERERKRAERAFRLEAIERRAAEVAQAEAEEARKQEASQRQRAERLREESDRQARISDRVAKILSDMLGSPDPWASSKDGGVARDTKVIDILDATAAGLDSATDLDPAVESRTRLILGDTYRALDERDKALTQSRQAHALAEELYGSNGSATLRCAWSLAMAHLVRGNAERARDILETCHSEYRRTNAYNRAAIQLMSDLALTYESLGEFDHAIELLREACDRTRASDDPELRDAGALPMHNLGSFLAERGRYDEAEGYLQEALDIRMRIFGPDSARTLAVLNSFALIRSAQQRHDEAQALQERVIEAATRELGPTHHSVLVTMINLAQTHATKGNYSEAIATYEDLVETARGEASIDAELHVRAETGLANLLSAFRKPDEALAQAHASVEVANRRLPKPNRQRALAYGVLGIVQDRTNHLEESFLSYARSLEEYEACGASTAHDAANIRAYWTRALIRSGQLEDALEQARLTDETHRIAFPDGHPFDIPYRLQYVDLLTQLEEFDEAEIALLEAFEEHEARNGVEDETTQQLVRALVDFYEDQFMEDDAAEFRDLLDDG